MKSHFILFAAILLVAGCKKDPNGDDPGNKPPQEKKWIVTTVAGDGTRNFSNGTALAAQFKSPADVVVAADGSLYVTDAENSRIRKISGGQVSTFAGNENPGLTNGNGESAQYLYPYFITVDANGNLYTSDVLDSRIRKITPAATVSTHAGSTISFFADGDTAHALFMTGGGVVADPQGNIFVSDTYNNRVRKISTAGQVSTIAGGDNGGLKNGNGAEARFKNPGGIAIDKQGNLYVADVYNFVIRKITPAGQVSTFAGTGEHGYADGNGAAALFEFPLDIVIDSEGNLYVIDSNRIRKITPQGVVSTIAGSNFGFADGEGTAAKFRAPTGLGIDRHDNLFVADFGNNRIRKISFE